MTGPECQWLQTCIVQAYSARATASAGAFCWSRESGPIWTWCAYQFGSLLVLTKTETINQIEFLQNSLLCFWSSGCWLLPRWRKWSNFTGIPRVARARALDPELQTIDQSRIGICAQQVLFLSKEQQDIWCERDIMATTHQPTCASCNCFSL